MALVQSNMAEFILSGQNQKGNTFKPAYLRIFCEVAMNMDKGELSCVFSRTEDIKITKDTRTNWLVIESVVLEHNLKECFNAMFKIAQLKALESHTDEQKKELEQLQSVTLSLKFKSIESEDLFKGKIPFDKFNTEFIKGIKSQFGLDESQLSQLDVSGWISKVVIPKMYSEVLSFANQDNQKNLFIAVFLDMVQSPEFTRCLTEFKQDNKNAVIDSNLFLQSISNVRKEAEAKELSTSKTFDFIRTNFELPAPKDVKLLVPVAPAPENVEGEQPNEDENVTVEPTVEGGEEE
jgi:hypothetical protein